MYFISLTTLFHSIFIVQAPGTVHVHVNEGLLWVLPVTNGRTDVPWTNNLMITRKDVINLNLNTPVSLKKML